MFRAIKGIIPILPVFLMAFSSTQDNSHKEIYYYKLDHLKEASAPEQMRAVKIDNGKTRVIQGVLITYKNRYAKDVKIAGDFSSWDFEEMDRSKNGVWYFLLDGKRFEKDVKYKFFVDGIWIRDPLNPYKTDDGYGSYVSIARGEARDEGRHITFRRIDGDTVEFRLYQPEARLISIVGDFNNWNPENDLLEKDKNGLWRLRKTLPRGIYRYMYIIDGEWTVDLYNDKTASNGTGGICSLISIK